MNFKEYASKFLYVPTKGRKIPLPDWKWVDNCQEGVDPRSEANRWVFTYEQTQEESLIQQIKDRYSDWSQDWIRVGSVEGLKWYNVDIDTDEESHEAVLEDPEEIGFEADLVSFIKTRGGSHLDILTTDEVPTLEGQRVEGIDYQGDAGVKGVAGDPFHGSDDYEVKNVGEVIESVEKITAHPYAAISYRDEALFDIKPEDDSPTHKESLELSKTHPLDMSDRYPQEGTFNRFAHPHHSSTSNSNTLIDNEGLAHCFRHTTTFNAYHDIGMSAGILECGEWDHHDEGYAGMREEIKEYCLDNDIPIPRHWKNGEWYAEFQDVDSLIQGDKSEIWDIRRELRAKAVAAQNQELSGHFVGPKASGKTFNMVSTAAREDTQVFAAAPTTDKYQEILQEADDMGVSALILPSFPRHSDIYEDWEGHYHAGAYPREIYGWHDDDVSDEYKMRSDDDWEDYDLLIGAPQHMFLESATKDRIVMADDVELGTFRDFLIDEDLAGVNKLLQQCSDEYESYQELERRGTWATLRRELIRTLSTEERFADINSIDEALSLVQDDELDRRQVIEGLDLSLETLDHARVMCDELRYGEDYIRYKREGSIRRIYKRVPQLQHADMVWTLGATFDRNQLNELFELMNVNFDGVFGVARHGDMERATGRVVIQTSDAQHVKSRADGTRANPERVQAIADGLGRLGDEEPLIFSTLSETRQLENAHNYGSLTGKNEFADNHLAAVGGAQHFGDDHVRDVAVSTGAAPDTPDRGDGFDKASWSCPVHQQVDDMIRWGGMYEAITRVGRDDAETTIVAVDSAALPPWLQTIDQSGRVEQLSGAERAVIETLRDADRDWQVKDHARDGLEDVTDFSHVRLYEAVNELVQNGWIEQAGTGDYNAKQFRVAENAPVNSDMKGLQMAKLTGDEVSEAQNPDWDMLELEIGQSVETDVRQMELSEIMPPG